MSDTASAAGDASHENEADPGTVVQGDPIAALPLRHSLMLGADGLVLWACSSSLVAADAVEVSEDVYQQAFRQPGRYAYREEALVELDHPAVAAPVIPDEISRRQFFMQNVAEGVVSEDEALAAMAGTLPAAFEAMVAKLPAEQRFPARMALAGQTFLRSSPFTAAFGALRDPPRSADDLDASWLAASKL